MKETSEKLLLAEHSRLVSLEMSWSEQYEKALQLYLTTIGIATGILLFVIEKGTTLNLPNYSVILLLAMVLAMGEVIFLRQIGLDVSMRQNAQALKRIREKLTEEDADLNTFFLKGLVSDKVKLNSFYSFKGIIYRAFTKTQQKTIVVLLNSTVFTALMLQFVWHTTGYWLTVISGALLFLFIGGVHGLYASFRYKESEKELDSGEISYWI